MLMTALQLASMVGGAVAMGTMTALGCKGGKNKGGQSNAAHRKTRPPVDNKPASAAYQGNAGGHNFAANLGPAGPPQNFAGTFDQNYQTMANMGDSFTTNQDVAAGKPMAGAFDPQYQTLAGMDNNQIFQDKGGPSPAVGGPVRMAGTHDPNYQTLAGMDNVFENRGGAAAGGGQNIAGTFDPNYQTLAGMVNVFENMGGADGVNKPTMAGTLDPNYQTLAGLDNNVFNK